jgi:hypothetical protein
MKRKVPATQVVQSVCLLLALGLGAVVPWFVRVLRNDDLPPEATLTRDY